MPTGMAVSRHIVGAEGSIMDYKLEPTRRMGALFNRAAPRLRLGERAHLCCDITYIGLKAVVVAHIQPYTAVRVWILNLVALVYHSARSAATGKNAHARTYPLQVHITDPAI